MDVMTALSILELVALKLSRSGSDARRVEEHQHEGHDHERLPLLFVEHDEGGLGATLPSPFENCADECRAIAFRSGTSVESQDAHILSSNSGSIMRPGPRTILIEVATNLERCIMFAVAAEPVTERALRGRRTS